ncbi:hypothetical protein [Streptomyces sp. URMC 129]|uniref:hypothetical protein n=1 Tax=Streptomyces sp. URMC 129 TaxID=3423407 RepID=UPI003F1E3A59
MVINGPVAGGSPGYALLIAATPARGVLVDAGGVLPALAALPPAALLGTATGSVVQLVAPGDPQAVLAALRTAAAHDGPLTVLFVGQLVVDRHGQPHLALAGTTARTVRYTALPWAWVGAELRDRPADSTAVVVDLTADAAAWARREETGLAADGLTVVGTVAPPPPRRHTATPRYAHALAAVLRAAGARPPLGVLHHQVLAHAELDTRPGGRLVLDTTGRPETAGRERDGDPHAAISAAARAGHHDQADALAAAREQAAFRDGGPHAPQALHWAEVRADLAWLAGRPERAAGLWMRVARARLAAGQQPTDPEVVRAVDQAHHCWQRLTDTAVALTLGTELAPLRRAVPGRRPGAVAALDERLAHLRAARGDG